MSNLEVLKGPNVGTSYSLTELESVVGRYPFCEVVIPSHTVSRQHARVSRDGEAFFIEDLGSLNGTFVNGNRIRGRTLLHHHDRIRIYDVLLLFHQPVDTLDSQKTSDTVRNVPPQQPQTVSPRMLETISEPVDTHESANHVTHEVIEVLQLRGGASDAAQIASMVKLASCLAGLADVDAILNVTLEHLFEQFSQVDRGHVLIAELRDDVLAPRAVRHRREDSGSSMTIAPISRTLAQQVMQHGEAFYAVRGADEVGDESSIFDSDISSVMCTPLLGPLRRPLGIIHLESSGFSTFSRRDLDLLVQTGMVVGQAVELAQFSAQLNPGPKPK